MSSVSWVFPPADSADENGLVGIGADLAPDTLITAYARGLFPMPIEAEGPIAWWSPDPRAVIPLDGLHVSRSLRRSMTRFTITIDTAFDEVIAACGDPTRPHGWIDQQMRDAYSRLHRLGWAHSVETRAHDGELVGGIYGVGIRRFFAGESMFHRANDASKVALAALVDVLGTAGVELFDVQWQTPHLASLGAIEISRSDYLRRLGHALTADPAATGDSGETTLSSDQKEPTITA
ncbi:MAG: leucyl/phenylalanyl-tRNA--protein transferase [Acidimicrobiia bacterium]|nr:leucyl/phenylalanyl-tRNA--protein transferase [Acidimicrobiia bacterium]